MRNYSSVPAYNSSIIWKSLGGAARDDVTILPGGAHKQGRDHESATHTSLKELDLFNGKFPSLGAYAEMNLWRVEFPAKTSRRRRLSLFRVESAKVLN